MSTNNNISSYQSQPGATGSATNKKKSTTPRFRSNLPVLKSGGFVGGVKHKLEALKALFYGQPIRQVPDNIAELVKSQKFQGISHKQYKSASLSLRHKATKAEVDFVSDPKSLAARSEKFFVELRKKHKQTKSKQRNLQKRRKTKEKLFNDGVCTKTRAKLLTSLFTGKGVNSKYRPQLRAMSMAVSEKLLELFYDELAYNTHHNISDFFMNALELSLDLAQESMKKEMKRYRFDPDRPSFVDECSSTVSLIETRDDYKLISNGALAFMMTPKGLIKGSKIFSPNALHLDRFRTHLFGESFAISKNRVKEIKELHRQKVFVVMLSSGFLEHVNDTDIRELISYLSRAEVKSPEDICKHAVTFAHYDHRFWGDKTIQVVEL